MNDKKSLIISMIITIIVLFIISSIVDLDKLSGELQSANLFYIFLALLSYLILNIFINMRISILLSAMGEKTSFKDSFFAHFGGMLASDFTPARSGYFLTAFLLTSQDQGKIEKTLTSIFAPQLLEFLLKVICTGILTFVLIGRLESSTNWTPYIIASILSVAVIVVTFLSFLFVRGLLEKTLFITKFPGGKKIYYLFWLMRENSQYVRQKWKEVLLLTISGWLFKGLEWYFVAQALGIHIFGSYYDYFFMLLFQAFLTLTHFIPLPTVAGAGAAEAVGSGVLAMFGISIESSIAFLFLTRVLMIAVDLIGLTAIIPLFRKESLDQVLNDLNKIEERFKVKAES